jgi:hypothetical protein
MLVRKMEFGWDVAFSQGWEGKRETETPAEIRIGTKSSRADIVQEIEPDVRLEA